MDNHDDIKTALDLPDNDASSVKDAMREMPETGEKINKISKTLGLS